MAGEIDLPMNCLMFHYILDLKLKCLMDIIAKNITKRKKKLCGAYNKEFKDKWVCGNHNF